MAGRPCPPTNPPPKRYKPPIMRKVQPHGNPQQQNTQQKIDDPTYGAGTPVYVAPYSQKSTTTRHPTMTHPTGNSHPTLPKNKVQEHETRMASNTINLKQPSPIHPVKLPAVVKHPMETNRSITQSKFQPLGPNNKRTTIQQTDTDITKTIGMRPINRSIDPPSLPENPKCDTRNNQPITRPSPTPPQPAHPCSHCKPSKFPTQTQPGLHSHLFPSKNQPNQPNPPNKLQPLTATAEASKIKPPSTHASCHPQPHQNRDPVITASAQQRSSNDQCNQTVKPTPSPPPHDETDSTHYPALTLLMNELAITRTLLDRLYRWLIPESSNIPSRTISKTLFELISDLPSNNPLPLLTTPSHTTAYLKNYSAAPPTYTTYWIPPNPTKAKTRITPYLSTILLWSMLQFTTQYSKDLLKVP